MPNPQSLPWVEPLVLAATVRDPYMVLLYSGVQASYSGRYSYLACGLRERIVGNDFAALEKKLTANRPALDNAWFGYLGYGLKDSLEKLAPDSENWLMLPKLCMMQFDTIYCFDHQEHMLTLTGKALPSATASATTSLPPVKSLNSNMTREEYLEKAAHIIDCIHRGDFYQANLTRKFIGSFEQTPDYFQLFRKLCEVSPAPYSAFIRMGEICVLSSSPELFLRIGGDGKVTSRPIKGTAPRFTDSARDNASRRQLAESTKDRAENLMIVDLMRNDLSRGCIPGSVQTEALFEVTSHATIHHMSSTITGQKRLDCSSLEIVKQCFPPGSMTGAPKITAMNICSQLEGQQRGIYSGAIGWFGGDGACELSVVIRTLIGQDTKFEFQVGGGIVADSSPQKELKELIDKSKGILSALALRRII